MPRTNACRYIPQQDALIAAHGWPYKSFTVEHPVSLIPSTAVTQALTPATRATTEAARAKQLQTQKDAHHQQEVELDDTAVNATHKEDPKDQQQKQQKKRLPLTQELLDISTLDTSPIPAHSTHSLPSLPPSLDISA